MAVAVRTLAEIAAARTDLEPGEVAHCESMLRDLGLLADLAFSDLILWLPVWNQGGFVAAAQVRPATASTRYPNDLVGAFTPRGRRPSSTAPGRRPGSGSWRRAPIRCVPAAGEAVGVGLSANGPWIAALTRSAIPPSRAAGTLERVYLAAADDLFAMIRVGEFPYREVTDSTGAEPRVGDGLIRMDAAGVVGFASPNASSAFRRLGLTTDLVGARLGPLSSRIARRGGAVDATVAWSAGAGCRVRSSSPRTRPPSSSGRSRCGRPATRGSLVLVRDVTELKRRERALLSKDATIREIHHRVKNNLQTVAALLRLQSRRLEEPGAAAALAEAERRVGAIAVVHDLLAQASTEEVPFDAVADRLVTMVHQTAAPEVGPRRIVRVGSFGEVSAARATALAMALVELLANAVEHGADDVELDSSRDSVGGLHVVVSDRGPGFPAGFEVGSSPRLGLRIVDTLVREELGGSLAIGRAGGRTQVRVHLPPERR